MKEQKLIIRKAAKENIRDIGKISLEAFEYHNRLLPDFFADKKEFDETPRYNELIDKENAVFLVALKEGVVAGYLLAMISDKPWLKETPVCSLDEIGVLSSCRHQGIGTSLFNALKEECRKRKIRSITLNVYANNEQAIDFYKKAGCRIRSFRMDMKTD